MAGLLQKDTKYLELDLQVLCTITIQGLGCGTPRSIQTLFASLLSCSAATLPLVTVNIMNSFVFIGHKVKKDYFLIIAMIGFMIENDYQY